MKSIVSIFLFMVVLAACDNPAVLGEESGKALVSDENTFRVKVAVTLCGYAILEILDERFYEYGISWTNNVGNSYNHVFGTTFPCYTEAATGDVITIQIVDTLESNDCARCEAYLQIPDKRYFVKVIERND